MNDADLKWFEEQTRNFAEGRGYRYDSTALELVTEVRRLRSALYERPPSPMVAEGLAPAALQMARKQERERCARVAEQFGPSRPPVKRDKQSEDRHLGECAASAGIARQLRELGD